MTSRLALAFLLNVVIVVSLRLPALAREQSSLGDLTIPAERVPTWNMVPTIDTSSWPVYDVVSDAGRLNADFGSSCSPATISGGSDAAPLQCMIDAVAGTNTVLRLPAGQIDLTDNQGLQMRSGVVLRGVGVTSVFHFQGEASFAANSCKSKSWINFTGSSGPSTTWTGGFVRGTRILQVADAGLFAPGDWITVHMNFDPNLVPRTSQPTTDHHFEYTARVESVQAGSITIDRPLRLDYTSQGGRTVRKINPVQGSGLENFKIISEGNDGGNHLVCWKNAVGNWFTGMEVGPFPHIAVRIESSAARNLVAHNYMHDTTGDQGFSSYPVNLVFSASDNQVHNNRFTNISKAITIQAGAIGNLITYNYAKDCNTHRRLVFFHGEYPSENLVEGNVADRGCNIDMDNHWGPQGERNTFFRNRGVDTRVSGIKPFTIRSHMDDFKDLIAFQPNLLLNFMPAYYQPKFCKGDPADGAAYEEGECGHWNYQRGNTAAGGALYVDPWAEGNVAYDLRSYEECRGVDDPYSCCSGNGDTIDSCAFGAAFHSEMGSSAVENFQTTVPPSEWSGRSYPYSLVAEWNAPNARPAGWCEEISAWPLMGADVDSLPISGLQKQPAHRLYDGDPCTPTDGVSVAAPTPPLGPSDPAPAGTPPPAPRLLE